MPLRRFALALATLALAILGAVPVADAGGARDYIVRYRESAVAGDSATVRVASGGARFQVRRVDRTKVDRRVRKAKGWGVKPRHVFRNGIGGTCASRAATHRWPDGAWPGPMVPRVSRHRPGSRRGRVDHVVGRCPWAVRPGSMARWCRQPASGPFHVRMVR